MFRHEDTWILTTIISSATMSLKQLSKALRCLDARHFFTPNAYHFGMGWVAFGLPKHDKKVQSLSLRCLNHEFNMPWCGFCWDVPQKIHTTPILRVKSLGIWFEDLLCRADWFTFPKSNMENAGFQEESPPWGQCFYLSVRKCNQFLPSSNLKIAGWKLSFSSWKLISQNGLWATPRYARLQGHLRRRMRWQWTNTFRACSTCSRLPRLWYWPIR